MKLHCIKFGQGRPLLILHGFMGMSDNWVGFGKRFEECFSLYLPDMRNHGRSPHCKVFDYDHMVMDVIDLIKAEDIIHPFIIGHSMGGKIAMSLCLKFPSLVEKCIVVDIGPGNTKRSLLIHQLLLIMNRLDLSAYRTLSEIDKDLQPDLSETNLRYFVLKNIRREKNGKFSWKLNLPVLTETRLNIPGSICNEGTYCGPIQFIKGSQSDFIGEHDKNLISKLFPNAVMIEIQNAGHWVHVDNPDDLFAVTSTFLCG